MSRTKRGALEPPWMKRGTRRETGKTSFYEPPSLKPRSSEAGLGITKRILLQRGHVVEREASIRVPVARL